MDWIIIGLVVLIIGSLIMNYFNYIEIRNLRKFNEYQTSCIDTINKRLRDNEYNNYENGRTVNARLNSYFENLTRNHEELISYRNVLRRLEPIAILADKFDIKRKLKYSSEHTNDLKADLKEIERELKDLT